MKERDILETSEDVSSFGSYKRLKEIAENLQCSERTLQKRLKSIKNWESRVKPYRLGRYILYNSDALKELVINASIQKYRKPAKVSEIEKSITKLTLTVSRFLSW